MIWLGLCEETAPDITAVRQAMQKVLPRQGKLVFFVPSNIDTKSKVEKFFVWLYRWLKPQAVVLNSDIGMFPAFELYIEFLHSTKYFVELVLDSMFVIDEHYEKRIVRDSHFEWYSRPYEWSEKKVEQ